MMAVIANILYEEFNTTTCFLCKTKTTLNDQQENVDKALETGLINEINLYKVEKGDWL